MMRRLLRFDIAYSVTRAAALMLMPRARAMMALYTFSMLAIADCRLMPFAADAAANIAASPPIIAIATPPLRRRAAVAAPSLITLFFAREAHAYFAIHGLRLYAADVITPMLLRRSEQRVVRWCAMRGR